MLKARGTQVMEVLRFGSNFSSYYWSWLMPSTMFYSLGHLFQETLQDI